MNNLIQLTKVAFFSSFNVNKQKKNQKSVFAIVGLFGFLFLAISFFYNFTFCMAFMAIYSLEEYLVFMYSVAGILTLMLSIFKIQSTIFRTKDYEFLESLPVSKKTIVASKLLALELICLFEDALICLPTIIFYGIFSGNALGCVMGVVGLLFISFIPLLVAALITYVFTILTGRSKFSNVINIVLYVAFFVSILIISFSFSMGMEGENDVLATYLDIMPYMRWLYHSLDASRWYEILYFLLANIACAVLVVVFISFGYRRINTRMNQGTSHTEYKMKSAREQNISADRALFKKEWSLLSKKPMYFVNSFLGPVFATVISIVFCQMMKNIGVEGGASPDEVEEIVSSVFLMVPAVILLMNSMMTSTSASFSIEGKEIEALKSYPLSIRQIVWAKLKIGILIPVLLNLVLNAVVCAVIQPSLPIILEIMILPLGACVLIAFIGMLCGLKWPKFDYTNEMQIFKNSMAVNLTMVFSLLICLVCIGLMVSLNFLNPYVSLGVAIVYYAIWIAVFVALLNKKQEHLFGKM